MTKAPELYDLSSEEALIGAILNDPDTIIEALEILKPDDFFSFKYRSIFQKMYDLWSEGKDINPLSVRDRLKKDEKTKFIEECVLSSIMVNTNLYIDTRSDSYASIILEASNLRKIYAFAENLRDEAGKRKNPTDLLASISSFVSDQIMTEKDEFISLYDMREELIDEYAKIKDGIKDGGIYSGFTKFDQMTNGLSAGDLMILAARPSMGKTCVALQMALNMARKKNSVAFYSLEMSNEQVLKRSFAGISRIPLYRIKNGTMNEEEEKQFGTYIDMLPKTLLINENPHQTISQIRINAHKLKAVHGLDVIFIDFLQLITEESGQKGRSREQAVSEMSRMLKVLARELEVPIICLSQLSRACELRNDKRPILSDLRESGAIEQNADIVSFLYRPFYYNNEMEESILELNVAKHRNGQTGKITLNIDLDTQRVFDNF